MIKKYLPFKESLNNIETIKSKREIWLQEVNLVISSELEYSFNNYSNFANKLDTTKIDAKVEKVTNLIISKGFTVDYLKNIFSKEANDLCGLDYFDFVESNEIDSCDGLHDIYLYNVAEQLGYHGVNNKIYPGGKGWCLYMLKEKEEAFIKYGYGYHKTKYGKMVLDKCGIDGEKLKEMADSYLLEYLLDEQWLFILSKFTEISQSILRLQGFENKQYFLIESDRTIINTYKAVEDLKIKFRLFNLFKSDLDELILDFLKIHDLDHDRYYDITDRDFIIYVNSDGVL